MTQTKFSTEFIQLKNYKGLSLSGYSRAAHRTGIEVVGLNILLDAGLDVQKCYSNIFITHQHLDHIIFLPQYTMNNDTCQTINIVSTQNILKNVQRYVISALRTSHNILDEILDEQILRNAYIKGIPLSHGSFYTFLNGKEKWIVESVKCFHGIDSIGFGFSVEKIKLKEEFISMNSKDIKKNKDNGIQITYNKIEKIFLFLGDTNKQIFQNPYIYTYPSIITECTYIYSDDISLAKKNNHIHWDEIKDIIRKNESIQFILIHFSMKYKKDEIIDFFQKENIENVEVLI
jgi:ribonuclease Z